MRHPIPDRRWATRGGTAVFPAVTVATGMQMAAAGAQAAATTSPAVSNPYSPAHHHSCRRGDVPTRPQLRKMHQWARTHPARRASKNLRYGGGIDGIGVTTGAENVIISPTGTHPDGFSTPSGQFCAWPDRTGDVGVSPPYGDVAFANFPYVTDLGASCGANVVNSGSAGTLDGVTIVEGC